MDNVYVVSLFFRVSHLILVDPWGFPEKPQPQQESSSGQVSEAKRPGPPQWVITVASVLSYFNPLAIVRLAGPWGESHAKHANSCNICKFNLSFLTGLNGSKWVFYFPQLIMVTFSVQVQDWWTDSGRISEGSLRIFLTITLLLTTSITVMHKHPGNVNTSTTVVLSNSTRGQ